MISNNNPLEPGACAPKKLAILALLPHFCGAFWDFSHPRLTEQNSGGVFFWGGGLKRLSPERPNFCQKPSACTVVRLSICAVVGA